MNGQTDVLCFECCGRGWTSYEPDRPEEIGEEVVVETCSRCEGECAEVAA